MADCEKGATAGNWMPNQPLIVPMPKTFEQLEERVESMNKQRNGLSWYLTFKQPTKECINEKEECNRLGENS